MEKEHLKQILVEQRNDFVNKKYGTEREKLAESEKYLKLPHVYVISGIRRCGKSTLMRQIATKYYPVNNYFFLNFEDERLFNFDVSLFNTILELQIELFGSHKTFFIDEIQNVPNFELFLRRLSDKGYKFIISGSNAELLSGELATKITGRHIETVLQPFNFREFLSYKDIAYLKIYDEYRNKFSLSEEKPLKISAPAREKLLKYYEEYLTFGGYPRVAIEENIETKKELLKNIYNTYFLREVRDILGLIDDYKLGVFIKGLALQTGNLIEYNELSNLTGYSYSSVKKYLNFLEKTYICKLVRPFFKNKRTEIVKNPKVYFIDTGIRNTVINDFRGLGDRIDKGSLLENGLAMQFIKQGIDFNFWRDKKKNEVDFILSLGNGKISAIESKTSLRGAARKIPETFKKNYPEAKILFSYWNASKTETATAGEYPIYLF